MKNTLSTSHPRNLWHLKSWHDFLEWPINTSISTRNPKFEKKIQFLPSYSKTFRFLLSWESTEDTSTIPYPWDGITWYLLSHDWVTWHGHMTKISRDFVIRAQAPSSTLGCKLLASLWNSLLIRIISTIWLDARLLVSRDHVIKTSRDPTTFKKRAFSHLFLRTRSQARIVLDEVILLKLFLNWWKISPFS